MAHPSVTSAEFQKGFGRYREAALKAPSLSPTTDATVSC